MAGFLSFFIYVVLIVIAINAAKKKKQNNGQHPDDPLQNLYDTMQNHISGSQSQYKGADVSHDPVPGAMAKTAAKPAMAKTKTSPATVVTSFSSSSSASDIAETSTTDYLEEKARQDQIEHWKEKKEEDQRINEKYGGRKTAQRYLLGDPIPRGCRLFYCPYCGAENLVQYSYRGGMNCYFCRTELK